MCATSSTPDATARRHLLPANRWIGVRQPFPRVVCVYTRGRGTEFYSANGLSERPLRHRHLASSPLLPPPLLLRRLIVSSPPSARAAYDRPPSSRPTGLAPCRLGTHPLLIYVKSIFPSVFPAPSPPPSDLV